LILRWVGALIALIGLAALVVVLGQIRIDRTPTPQAGAANLAALWPYWIVSAVGWTGLTCVWISLRGRGGMALGGKATFWRTGGLILLVALLARIAVVLSHQPALSDDVYRYVLDGRNAAHGINPYMVKPADRVGLGDQLYLQRPLAVILAQGGTLEDGERWPGERELLVLVNNPDQHTLYLPVSQWVFAGVGHVLVDHWTDPADGERAVRGVMVAFELGTIALLLVALRRRARSAWWVALYAWNPLALAEIAGSGHQEALGLFFLMLALVLWQWRPQQVLPWTASLALGALVKPVVLPVALLLLRGQRWWRWVVSALVGAAVCAVVSAPLLMPHDGEPLDNLTVTAERFSLKWAHFGSVYEPLLDQIERRTSDWTNDEQEVLARRICLALVGLVFLAIFFLVRDIWAAVRMLMLALLLLSPTAHPWYALWALAVAPLAMSPGVWIASLTISWSYAQLGDVVSWTDSPWVMVGAYAPIYGALILHFIYKRVRQDIEDPFAGTAAPTQVRQPGGPPRPASEEKS
jgi:hypothetical protein